MADVTDIPGIRLSRPRGDYKYITLIPKHGRWVCLPYSSLLEFDKEEDYVLMTFTRRVFRVYAKDLDKLCRELTQLGVAFIIEPQVVDEESEITRIVEVTQESSKPRVSSP